MTPPEDISQSGNIQNHEELQAAVAEAIRGLHFGSIQITVHEGRVTQLERIERVRFISPNPAQSRSKRG